MTEWRPIETYPRTLDRGWGPEVLVRLPEQKTHLIIHGKPTSEFIVEPTRYVAHLEADVWLTRSGDDPIAWQELSVAPTHWAPLPD